MATQIPPKRTRYHHGNLRQALLQAGEHELAERGIEGFSLRGVAKRAGVSHAAPAHHFADANALLSALAAIGFERFLATQLARQKQAPADPVAQLAAAGLGYVDFATANPALFRLMFASDRPDFADPKVKLAADAALQHLVNGVSQLPSAAPRTHEQTMLHAMTVWAMVHGLADLLNGKRAPMLLSLDAAARESAILQMLRPVIQAIAG